MVAFQVTDLPPTINTVESLAAWATLVLANLHFQMEIQEEPGVLEKVATAQPFPVVLNGQYQWRYAGRVSLPLNISYQSTGKLWQHIGTLSNASIPQDFKS
jgi:hypothetical protein